MRPVQCFFFCISDAAAMAMVLAGASVTYLLMPVTFLPQRPSLRRAARCLGSPASSTRSCAASRSYGHAVVDHLARQAVVDRKRRTPVGIRVCPPPQD